MTVGTFLGAVTAVGAFITQALNGVILFPQLLRQGPCPNVPAVNNFDLNAYLGRWYELERYTNLFQNGACVTADYALFPNGSISVINTQVTSGNLNSAFGIATPGPDPSVGNLIVSFPGPFGAAPAEPNYKIVSTDYTTHSVVYSCSSFAGKRIEFSWILSREPYLPKSQINELKADLAKYGIDVSRYVPTRQLNCRRRLE